MFCDANILYLPSGILDYELFSINMWLQALIVWIYDQL